MRSLTSITIPEGVTKIEEWTFSTCRSLTSITIPATVTSIGNYAFVQCSSLTDAMIPDSVTSIGHNAFTECTSLTSVTIPDSVMSIGSNVFTKCTSLTDVTISNSATRIGGNAFSDTPWLENYPSDLVILNGSLQKYKGKDAVVVIPEHVTEIGDSAFYGCDILTDVMIPDSVTSIGRSAFYRCSNLTGVTIPDSVTSIGWNAFSGCSSLTSVTIPDSVVQVGDGAFKNCRITMCGITFTVKVLRANDFINLRRMLQTKDFSLQLSTEVKYAAIVGLWLQTGDADAADYIEQNIGEIMPFLIENNNTEAIRRLLKTDRFVTKENIDSFIGCAIEYTQNGGDPEIQTMLLRYKADVPGYVDPTESLKL